MGRMGELDSAVAKKNRQLRSIHGRGIVRPAVTPIFLEDMQREHNELLAWLIDHHHAVSQGGDRIHLLAISDATLACARKHFLRSVRECCWSRLQRHQDIHCRITEEIEACRIAADCALSWTRCRCSSPGNGFLFNQLGARFKPAQQAESGNIESTGLRRQPWKT